MGMLNESEWLTRKKRIDTRLCAPPPPWKIIRYRDGLNLSSLHCVAVEEFPTENGPADYALFVNGILLGIIEAKKVTVNPQNVLEQPSHTFVYVSTIQRMARNLFGAEGCFVQSGGDTETEADADKLEIPIHAFDIIIADECHRSYTAQEMSVWRDTINHFDAIKIGLTATPAAHTRERSTGTSRPFSLSCPHRKHPARRRQTNAGHRRQPR
jgi:type I site-specific restriction endonuclease